jgi:trehalose 6-phosphate synthase
MPPPRIDPARRRSRKPLQHGQQSREISSAGAGRLAVGFHGGIHACSFETALGADPVSRLVAVSNRIALPARGAVPGGLAVGLLAAMRDRGGLWFGWDGNVAASSDCSPVIVRQDAVSYAATGLDELEYADYYLGFCNSLLWPLFHYFIDAFQFRDEHYAAFLGVNRRMAAELIPLLHPEDVVWVHDYHLIPLGSALRASGVRQPIGFFLHIPFPSYEVLRILPVHVALLRQLSRYDVIGFQTASDLAAFRDSIAQVWGPLSTAMPGRITVEGHTAHTDVFAIGVDVDAIRQEAARSQDSEECSRMSAGLLGRRLMLGVDRLDYSKGLVQRFRAYERFLDKYPENRNQVTFLQIAPLSRTDVRAYSQIRRDLEQATGRTNGRFADTDWTPIRYLNRNFSHEVLMGFLRRALVGIVTPVRDGMNLVAKEFVAAQVPDDPGVLVLSSLAGAARELDAAILVNPHDTCGMADAIQQAFNMPLAERRTRHEALLAALRRNSLHAWHARFVEALEAVREHAVHA